TTPRPGRDPARDRQRAHRRGRRAACVGGAAAVRGVAPGAERRAVIFDLWETLIDWDADAAARMVDRIDALAGPGFRDRWYRRPNRYLAPVRTVLAEAGVPPEA